MLLQETNYLKEVELIKKYSEKASGQYIIPKVYERYSSESCLCLEYIEGKKLGEVELSLDERNKLTQEFFELFLDEIFKWGLMQTDAHHGNYLLVKKDESYIWALLDFGATKIISQEQQQSYSLFLNSIVDQEPDIFFEELEKNISLNEEVKEKLWKHVCLVLEPLLKDEYNFKTSELPKRIIQSGIKMIGDIKVHEYPIENIFIDRKIAGVYSILRELDPSVSLRTLYFDWKEQCSQ